MTDFLTRKEKRKLRKGAEISLDLFRAGVRLGKQKYAGHKASERARRLEQAHIVKALRESNLPRETQMREIEKLRQTRISKAFKEGVRKSRLPVGRVEFLRKKVFRREE